jgi:hypothetical protein
MSVQRLVCVTEFEYHVTPSLRFHQDVFKDAILGGGDFSHINAGNTGKKELRWLQPCRIIDIYEEYKLNCQSKPASTSVFYRVWQKWKHSLRRRKKRQHARCADCAELSKFLRDAKTAGLVFQITKHSVIILLFVVVRFMLPTQ